MKNKSTESTAGTAKANTPLFDFKAKPSLKQVAPLGLQHVVAAVVGIITPAIMISREAGLSAADQTMLVQMSLIVSALATLLQLFPLGRVGAGLPVIIGTSFAYMPTMLAIVQNAKVDNPNLDPKAYVGIILGAQIFGGAASFLVGLFVTQIRKLFPPLVTGTVIFTIGLSLYTIAVRYMAGGGNPPVYDAAGTLISGNQYFGSWSNWLVALFTLAVVVGLNHFTKGFMKLASILIGMVAGYLLAIVLDLTGLTTDMVVISGVATESWFQLIPPMHFGIRFVPSAIISMVIMFVVNAVQAIGDFSSTTLGGMDREPTDKELSGGIMANGIVSAVSAFLGGLPTATYSQNVGIVTVTRVINRLVFAFAAVVLLIAGFIPKFSALLTTIPQCVIGGATLSVFASITMTGIKMIASAKLTPRNTTVVGLAVALGVGVTQVSQSLYGLPAWVNSVFGSSSVVIATLVAILLNLILPKDKSDTKPAEKAKKA